MHIARKVYEKFLIGDPIEDDELNEAIVFFKDLSDSLHSLGPVFALPANEAARVYLGLGDFRRAREHSQAARPKV